MDALWIFRTKKFFICRHRYISHYKWIYMKVHQAANWLDTAAVQKMQFVYSAGTAASPCPSARYSPTPSPRPSTGSRTPRGWAGWRPVSPGYRNTPADKHRTVEIKHVTENDGSLRDSIPLMSRPLAVFCLVCNICLPGLGNDSSHFNYHSYFLL